MPILHLLHLRKYPIFVGTGSGKAGQPARLAAKKKQVVIAKKQLSGAKKKPTQFIGHLSGCAGLRSLQRLWQVCVGECFNLSAFWFFSAMTLLAGGLLSATVSAQEQNKPEQVADSKGFAVQLRSPYYSHLDWVPREQLTSSQQAEVAPWCSGTYIEPQRPGMSDDTPIKQTPTHLSARVSRYEQQKQVTSLAGEVVLRQGSLQVEADEARLYQAENRAELSGKSSGGVRLRDKGALLVGDRAELQIDSGSAQVDNAEYVLHATRTRGGASYIKRDSNGIIRLKNGSYTQCAPDSNAWHLRGNNITLDTEAGFGTATNVTLRIKNLPVLYTPYIRFPIDDRRVSGFLMPAFGSSKNSGAFLQTPYYFNLAPNYDATLYPTWMSKRGLYLEGEGRYLLQDGRGSLGAAFLADQDDERKLQSGYSKTRWLYNWQHQQGFNSRLLGEVDYSRISDPYFFQDLSSELLPDAGQVVDQRGSLTWRGDSYRAWLALHTYELASVVQITPYDRLPQLGISGTLPFEPGGLQFAYHGQYTRFTRDLRHGSFTDKNGVLAPWYDQNLVGLERSNAERLHLAPSISLPLSTDWGFIKPSLKYVYTDYRLTLDSLGKSQVGSGFDKKPSVNLLVSSLDAGLYFERKGKNSRQTLEPRLFYLYAPEKDQQNIPAFDTAENSFSYDSLWRDNRFTGYDRIGDANQLSLGVTARQIMPDGFERQRVSVGQIRYFSDRKVQMPGINYKDRRMSTNRESPYALLWQYHMNRDWNVSTTYNWDANSHRTHSGSMMFHYQPEDNPRKIINLGYRYRNDTLVYNSTTGNWQLGGDYLDSITGKLIRDYYKIEQHDFSVMWPIFTRWSLLGRWQYDYNRSRNLETLLGVEYESCCWKTRFVAREWLDDDQYSLSPILNEKHDRGVFLQVVFKGLGGISGNKVESFMNGIEGYQQREKRGF